MPINIQYFGHSGYVIDDGTHRVAIDLFLTDNPLTEAKPENIKCDYVALTHAHEDHFGEDTLTIAKNNNATVIAAYELANFIGSKGIEEIEPGGVGGRIKTDFGYIAFTQALHSSSYLGNAMGAPCGLIINIGGINIYHTGDTDIFSDMKLIGERYQPHVAMLPIGDRFTMGPETASLAADYIGAKYAVPNHYNTWPPITANVEDFKPSKSEVKVLQPGETWTLNP